MPPVIGCGVGLGFERGSSGLWTPASGLDGCQSWYRADMGITSLPGIARWLDLSGAFGHINQVVAANKPTLVGSELIFDGLQSYLDRAVLPTVLGDYTVAIAVQYDAFPAGPPEYVADNGQVGADGIRFGGSGGLIEQDHGGVAAVNWGPGTTAPETWVFRYDSVGGVADFCRDGVHQGPQGLPPHAPPGPSFSLGASIGGAVPTAARIVAVYFYDSRSNDADTDQLAVRLAALQAGTAPPALPGAPVLSLERPDLHAGEAVTDWANQGLAGAARDIAQAGVNNQPCLIPWDPTVLQPFVHFDGVNDYLAGAWAQAQPVHRFAALLPTEQAVANDTMWDGAAGNSCRLYQSGANRLAAYAGAALSKLNPSTAVWQRVEAGYNGAASRIRRNDLAPVLGNIGAAGPGGLKLGTFGAITSHADTRIADFFECDQIQTPGNQTDAHAYMTGRYGI